MRINAAWIRVSNDTQTFDSQQLALEKMAAANGVSLKFFYDKGTGSKMNDLEEFQRLMSKVRSSQIECIYCYDLTRFSRSASQLLNTVEELKRYNCNLKTIKEGVNLFSPLGELLIGILGTLSQWERQNIIQRVRAGVASYRANGGTYAGRKPNAVGRKTREAMPVIEQMVKADCQIADICRATKLSYRTVKRLIGSLATA